ncbi:MAG: gamma-glutamylcyclotransferase [Arcobacter sp.]|nr:gamma-glutamylcyclotransferase [Arcobacter sp.]
MKNLVVYGSLLNKKELLKENVSLKNIECVKVYGYKRIFNQEPSYRLLNSLNRSVLNIEENKESWFNALVIKNISIEYINTLDKREKGYNKVFIKDGNVKTYDNNDLFDCIVYKGKQTKRNDKILPNFDYLNICLNGAKDLGNSFFKDFLKTTYKNSSSGEVLI